VIYSYDSLRDFIPVRSPPSQQVLGLAHLAIEGVAPQFDESLGWACRLSEVSELGFVLQPVRNAEGTGS
jgi:hypothetical protein